MFHATGFRGDERKTKNPHRGMNSKRRSRSWSYPGAGRRQREQMTDVLLPRSAETVLVNLDGWSRKNAIEFTGCREYVADSMIRFDSVDPAPPVPPVKKK